MSTGNGAPLPLHALEACLQVLQYKRLDDSVAHTVSISSTLGATRLSLPAAGAWRASMSV